MTAEPLANPAVPLANLDHAISCSRLRKAFLPRKRGADPYVALNGVDLAVPDGQFLSILGPSGCGKTTLLNILAGIEAPTAGTVTISPRIQRRAYLFQRDTLLPWKTAIRNVELGLATLGLPAAERQLRARHWLELVGLGEFSKAYPSQLSGGMRRRVALAVAFSHTPQVLFMDEPFASVDAQTRLQLQGELLRLWEGDRRTVIFVTHDIDEALLLGDRVVVMGPGKIVDDFELDIPRPRTIDAVRFEPKIAEMGRRIWSQLAEGHAQ